MKVIRHHTQRKYLSYFVLITLPMSHLISTQNPSKSVPLLAFHDQTQARFLQSNN